jgi:hypothetical protein
MRYALLLCHDESVVVGTDPGRVASFNAFAEKMGDRLLGSARLRPTTTATTVRLREGDVVVADGPFAERPKYRSPAFSWSSARTSSRRSKSRRPSPAATDRRRGCVPSS